MNEIREQNGGGLICAVRADARLRVALQVLGVVGFALATAIGARIAIPLPNTPVPITLQTLFVLLAGVTLGGRLGAASMGLYLLLGLVGMPVFGEGLAGTQVLFGATGGYLLGFVLAQPVLGYLTRARRTQRSWTTTLAALVAANTLIFGCGLLWLSLYTGGDVAQTLAWGLWPFAVGLIAKTLMALGVGQVALAKVRPAYEA